MLGPVRTFSALAVTTPVFTEGVDFLAGDDAGFGCPGLTGIFKKSRIPYAITRPTFFCSSLVSTSLASFESTNAGSTITAGILDSRIIA